MMEQPPGGPVVDANEVEFTHGELGFLSQRDIDSQAKLLKWFVSTDDIKEPFGFRTYITKSIALSNYENPMQLEVVEKYMSVILEYHSLAVNLQKKDEEPTRIQYALFKLAMKRWTQLKAEIEAFRGQDAKERTLAATTRLEKFSSKGRQRQWW